MHHIKRRWSRFWVKFAGLGAGGKIAARLAAMGTPPYYGRLFLAKSNPKGYISYKAMISHPSLVLNRHVYVDDNVVIFDDKNGGPVELRNGVHLHRDSIIQTGQGGSVAIGAHTHIQPRCQLSAYMGPITIGQRVEIAPNCAFYSYNHGMAAGKPVREQALFTKGGIVIEDDAWISCGVTVLDGVTIGKGAVVGAGAVVTKDLPENSISFGVPAQVVKNRLDVVTERIA